MQAAGIFMVNAILSGSGDEIIAAAAIAVRIGCVTEGRLFSSQAQSFMEEIIFSAGLPWKGGKLVSLKR